jgi:hypothetical protein
MRQRVYGMSFGVLRDQILTRERQIVATLPSKNINGSAAVAIEVGAEGKVQTCSRTASRGATLPMVYVTQTTNAICDSVSKWQFKKLIYCGRPSRYRGPLVFRVVNSAIALEENSQQPEKKKND